MPITTIELDEQSRMPGAFDRLNEQARNLVQFGHRRPQPLGVYEKDERGVVTTFKQTFESLHGMGLMASMTAAMYRPRGNDPDFDPIEHIHKIGMADDPEILALVERGQFMNSYTEEQFRYDLENGRAFLADAEKVGRAGTATMLLAMGGQMITDPANFIPGVVGVKLLKKSQQAIQVGRTLSNLRHIGRVSGGVSAYALAYEKLNNQLQPVSNEPGLSNELFTVAMAAGLGSTIGTLTMPSVAAGLKNRISSRRVKLLRQSVERSVMEPAFKQTDAAGNITDETGQLISIVDQVERDSGNLTNALVDGPMENGVISILRDLDPENEAALATLRQQYADAGETLHVIRHPEQWFVDLRRQITDIMDHSGMNSEAVPADFDHNLVTRGMAQINRGYANWQAKVTTGGRLAQSVLGRFTDVYRTVSASAQTVTQGQAQHFATNQTGAAGEAIAFAVERAKDQAERRLRTLWNGGGLIAEGGRLISGKRRGGGIRYNGEVIDGRRGYKDYKAAITDYMRRQFDLAHGFDETPLPTDVSGEIVDGVSIVRDYFTYMRDRMAETDLLAVSPKLLESLQDELPTFQRDLDLAVRNVETARAAKEAAAQPLVDEVMYTGREIDRRVGTASRESTGSLEASRELSHLQEAQMAIEARFTEREDLHTPEFAGFVIREEEWLQFTPKERSRLGSAGIHSGTEDAAEELRDFLGDRLYNNAIDEALAGRQRFTKQTYVDSVLNDPMNNDPEAILDAWLWREWHWVMETASRKTKRVSIDPSDLKDGQAVRIFGVDFVASEDEFGSLVLVSQGIDNEFIIPASQVNRVPVDASSIEGMDLDVGPANKNFRPKVARYRARQQRAEQALARHRARISGVSDALGKQEFYFPTVYNRDAILANPGGFMTGLVNSFNKSLRKRGNPLVPEVVANMDLAFRKRLDDVAAHKAPQAERVPPGDVEVPFDATKRDIARLGESLEDLTIDDLPPDLAPVYRAELDAFHNRVAQHVHDTVTSTRDVQGVAEAHAAQDPLMSKVLDIDQTEVRSFLEQDLELVLQRYSRALSGRIGVRRAIQLNPQIWEGVTLRDGSPIRSGDDLMAYLNETVIALERYAAWSDETLGNTKKLAPLAAGARKMMDRDIAAPMDFIEGRRSRYETAFPGIAALARSATRVSYANKLGSVLWAQINDLAPMTLFMMQSPRTLVAIPRVLFHLRKLPRKDLERLGLYTDSYARQRLLADIDYEQTGIGFGSGATKQITARMERGLQRVGDINAKVSLMNWITDANKRLSGVLVMGRLEHQSKRLIKFAALTSEGMDEAAALRKAGFRDKYEAARLNKMGFNIDRANRYHRLEYEHGLTLDDEPIRSVMSFDEYVNDVKRNYKPNWDAWPERDQSARDLLDIITNNITAEVNHSMVVTPGAFDRPIINFNVIGRMFNQFQTFGMAFVNQRLRVMGQMPARYQLWYIMMYQMLGSVSEAVASDLSGKRTLAESAELWKENPLGMSYVAFERSGLAGWLGRPLAIADAMQIPFSPGVAFDETAKTTAARHIQPGKALTYLGPAFSDADRMFQVGVDLLRGDVNERTAYNTWKTTPYQNLLWWRILHRATGAPVVPEALPQTQRRFERQRRKEGPSL